MTHMTAKPFREEPRHDPAHSQVERRLILLGRSHSGKLLVVVHTERGDNLRVISARRASRRERKCYEEGE